MEHLDRINPARVHVEFFFGEFRSEGNRFSPVTVDSGEFEGEVTIKEDPDVVVTAEGEGFVADVFKIGLKFRGEESHVGIAAGGIGGVEPKSLEGPPAAAGIGMDAGGIAREGERAGDGEVHVGVAIPVGEDFRARVKLLAFFIGIGLVLERGVLFHVAGGAEPWASVGIERVVNDVITFVIAVAGVALKIGNGCAHVREIAFAVSRIRFACLGEG